MAAGPRLRHTAHPDDDVVGLMTISVACVPMLAMTTGTKRSAPGNTARGAHAGRHHPMDANPSGSSNSPHSANPPTTMGMRARLDMRGSDGAAFHAAAASANAAVRPAASSHPRRPRNAGAATAASATNVVSTVTASCKMTPI